jgi:hypothetical protein
MDVAAESLNLISARVEDAASPEPTLPDLADLVRFRNPGVRRIEQPPARFSIERRAKACPPMFDNARSRRLS